MADNKYEREQRWTGVLAILALWIAVSVGSGTGWAQDISATGLALTEIAADPVTLTRTYKLDIPNSGFDDPFLTIELTDGAGELAFLDPQGVYLFNAETAGLEEDLDGGTVSDGLKQIFFDAGQVITAQDAVEILEEGRRWRITPLVMEEGPYLVLKGDGVLHVYQEYLRMDDFLFQLDPARLAIDLGNLLVTLPEGGGFVLEAASLLNEDFTGNSGGIAVYSGQHKLAETAVEFSIPAGQGIFLGEVPDPPFERTVPDEYCSCHAGRVKPPQDKWKKMLKDEWRRRARAQAAFGTVAVALPVVRAVMPQPKVGGVGAGDIADNVANLDKMALDAAPKLFDAAIRSAKQARDPYVKEEIPFAQIVAEAISLAEAFDSQESEQQRFRDQIAGRLSWQEVRLDQFYQALEEGFKAYDTAIDNSEPLEMAFDKFQNALFETGYFQDDLKQFSEVLYAVLAEGQFGDFPAHAKFLEERGELLLDLEQVQSDIVATYIVLDFNKDFEIPDESFDESFGEPKLHVLLNYHDPGTSVYFDEFSALDAERREHYLVGTVEIGDQLPTQVALWVDPDLLRADENIIYTIGAGGIDAEFAVRRIRLVQNLKGVRIPVVASSQEEADRLAEELLLSGRPAGSKVLPLVPDLTLYPEDLRVSPGNAETSLEITVRNFSMVEALDVPVQILSGKPGEKPVLLAEEIIPSVAAMGAQEVLFSRVSLEGGGLIARVNPERQIEELDYANNEVRLGAHLTGAIGLAITPAELKVIPGQEFAVELLGTADAESMLDVYLNFDPSYLEVVRFEPNEELGLMPLVENGFDFEYFDNAQGHIDFTGQIFSADGASTQLVQVELATVTFKTKSAPPEELPIHSALEFNLADPRKAVLFSFLGDEIEIAPESVPVQILSSGAVEGKVALQGREAGEGAVVYIDGEEVAVTDAEGRFQVTGLEETTHTIEILRVGFLSAGRGDVEVRAAQVTRLPRVLMLAGDPVADDVVDEADLTYITERYDSDDANADLNGDGAVDGADLALAETNLGTRARSPWFGQIVIGDPVEEPEEPEVPVIASPVLFDFDLAEGYQAEKETAGGEPDKVYTLQLVADDVPEVNGWSAVIEYDPGAVRYVSGSFAASDFVPGLLGLVDEKESSVGVGGAVLVGEGKNSGDGVLGTLSFELLKGFADSTELVIGFVSFRRIDKVDDQRTVRAVATITSKATEPVLLGDFDGTGRVDFSDFFLFADGFGGNDPQFDLDSSGRVDFNDFFIFADAFGEEARAKLIALAQTYLGLPESSSLEPNFPNPFNALTTLRYRLAEKGAVHLDIYSVTGQRIRTLVDEEQGAGAYEVVWDGRDARGLSASSGVYLARLQGVDFVQVRKMLLTK